MKLIIALARIEATAPGMRSAFRRGLQRLRGRSLACEAAARLSNCQAEDFQISSTGNVGPVVTRCPPHALGTVVGITHSGSWVCGAAARELPSLGIDVQVTEPRDVTRLARFMNWTRLLGLPGDEASDLDRFTQLWTLWEAAVKVDGCTVMSATTAAFASLAPQFRPGYQQSWSAGGYAAQSLRLDSLHWLTVVTPCAMLPRLELHHCNELAVDGERP